MERPINIAEAAHAMSMFSRELHRRAENILDHLHGPRPTEAENSAPVSGVIGTLEQVAANHMKLERALTAIESSLGVGSGIATAQNVAPPGVLRGR